MRAARIENGLVADLWMVPSLGCYGPEVILVEAPDHVQLGATYDPVDGFTNPPPVVPTANVDELRAAAYRVESDPIYFKWQRSEATQADWLASIQAIKDRYPKPE